MNITHDELPVCPITQYLMVDPVIDRNGHKQEFDKSKINSFVEKCIMQDAREWRAAGRELRLMIHQQSFFWCP